VLAALEAPSASEVTAKAGVGFSRSEERRRVVVESRTVEEVNFWSLAVICWIRLCLSSFLVLLLLLLLFVFLCDDCRSRCWGGLGTGVGVVVA